MAENIDSTAVHFKVAGTPGVGSGRRLAATKSFAPGETIYAFKPLLAMPHGASMRTTCNYCLVSENPTRPAAFSIHAFSVAVKLYPCTGCHAAVYCSKICQKRHWKEREGGLHKLECPVFNRARARAGMDWLPTAVRATAQVLLTTRFGDAAMISAFGNGPDSLEGHEEEFKKDKEAWKDIKLQAMGAMAYTGFGDFDEWAGEKAAPILCKIKTNGFLVENEATGMAGLLLEPTAAMINHSCEPNACVMFDFCGRYASVAAIQPIKEGEEITISYIDSTLPKEARQKALKKQYHFECTCPKCSGIR
ncbi:hypothetical protein QBC46DRAFT_395408 [Diplogelasinospora grovesii]|uniref:Suppressor of anucleate metulae protein B n=1 Tax=Diplogelasinospora grovesii TaxID=303347 RepID=A0AAN6MZL4_9PEZI|nr:hypothetical protein QBC46DRAFT_395408 [Diplogelasinospora grovesii]